MTLTAEALPTTKGPRNFALAGWSPLVQPCPDPDPSPTPTPTPPPSCSCNRDAFPKGTEECTNQDLWLWGDELKDPAATGDWTVQNANDFSSGTCLAYVVTKGGDCAQFCEQQGLVCTRGMDDAHYQSSWLSENEGTRCSIFPGGHDRKSVEDSGCNQKWQTQFCSCGCPDARQLFLDNCEATWPFEKACNVGFANPKESSDTTRDNLDLVFHVNTDCVSLGVDDNGFLLASTSSSTGSCDNHQYIYPELVAADGNKEVVFPSTFVFQVEFIGSTRAPETMTGALSAITVELNTEYKIKLLATQNVISVQTH